MTKKTKIIDSERQNRGIIKKKQEDNRKAFLALLRKYDCDYRIVNEASTQYQVEGIHFWPMIGIFKNPNTGQSGEGVKNLLKALGK